jgi:predicted ATPase
LSVPPCSPAGFTLHAAELVCADDLVAGDDVADVIAALVDKSLLVLDQRWSTTRYTMLDTFREFARERLIGRSAEASATLAHADHFAAVAREAAPHIRGRGEAEYVALLDAEIANFRVAHARARRVPRESLAAEVSANLVWFAFWRMRAEVFSWAERLADGLEGGGTALRAEALAAAGRGAWMRAT